MVKIVLLFGSQLRIILMTVLFRTCTLWSSYSNCFWYYYAYEACNKCV